MFITDATHLPRLMQCFGSSQMPTAPKDSDADTTARDEGNAAHYMAEMVFTGRATLESLSGQKAYNGVLMDADMTRHVGEYLAALDCGEIEVVTSFGDGANWQVNARADHISWRVETLTLTVDDFKYGHRLVEPENNWTLIAHAIGYCIMHQIAPERIVLRIHQPRRYHPDGPVREWVITYAELIDLRDMIARRLSEGDTTLFTGPECAKCPAAATCPAYRESSMNAIDAASAMFTDDMDAEALSRELVLLEQAESVITERLKALKEFALHRCKNGEVIPMYAAETTMANRRFKFDAATLKMITGVDATEPKLITPAEYVRRGVSEDVLKNLTERPITGVKLVRSDSNKRAERLLKKGKSNAR